MVRPCGKVVAAKHLVIGATKVTCPYWSSYYGVVFNER